MYHGEPPRMQMAAESKSLGFNSAALDILSNSVVNEPPPPQELLRVVPRCPSR
jgi:hypothetical protein